MSSDADVREFNNALITIKGNALRSGNSVFSIKNIVSLTFDSIKKEKPEPASIVRNYKYGKYFFIYFFLTCLIFLVFHVWSSNDQGSMNPAFEWVTHFLRMDKEDSQKYVSWFHWSIPISLLLSFFFYMLADYIKLNHAGEYYIHGLRIIFVNNMSLYFIADSDTGFIKETIDGLEEFISNPAYREQNEMVINFSNNSVNIKEVSNSNVIGGDVQGDVSNEK